MRSRHPRGRRRADGTHVRSVASRDLQPRILIVCEGERTEPRYLEAFPVTSLTVEVHGTGRNTLSLVEEAARLHRKKRFDKVWCVFDRDSFPKEAFNAALQKARTLGFEVAWSNECFEVWYLLHFAYLNPCPADDNPSTTVHELVLYLNAHSR